jgi:hypothetical protein
MPEPLITNLVVYDVQHQKIPPVTKYELYPFAKRARPVRLAMETGTFTFTGFEGGGLALFNINGTVGSNAFSTFTGATPAIC